MRKIQLLSIVFIVGLTAVAIPSASASDTGFYLGVGIGKSSIEILDFYPSLGEHVSQDNVALKAYGGYRLLKFVAFEAGYTSFGSIQGLERNVQEHPERAEVNVKGLNAFAVGILPVSQGVDFFAKIGVMSWDTKITSVQDADLIYSESVTGTDAAYGIGIGFWVGKNVRLSGEGEWFKIGDFDTVALYTVNTSYTF